MGIGSTFSMRCVPIASYRLASSSEKVFRVRVLMTKNRASVADCTPTPASMHVSRGLTRLIEAISSGSGSTSTP